MIALPVRLASMGLERANRAGHAPYGVTNTGKIVLELFAYQAGCRYEDGGSPDTENSRNET